MTSLKYDFNTSSSCLAGNNRALPQDLPNPMHFLSFRQVYFLSFRRVYFHSNQSRAGVLCTFKVHLYLSTICKVLGMYSSTFLGNLQYLYLSTFKMYFDFQVLLEYFGLFYRIIFLIQKWVTGVDGTSCSLGSVSSVAIGWGPHICLLARTMGHLP